MSKRWWRPARLVFLTVHEDADFARAALDAGGLGYVVKARLASDLLGSFPANGTGLAVGRGSATSQLSYPAELSQFPDGLLHEAFRKLFRSGVSPTKVRKVPQDSCQLPGRKGFAAIPESQDGTWFSRSVLGA